MTASLLASGATINEINCLRKHTSVVKEANCQSRRPRHAHHPGPRRRHRQPAFDVIASGPTVPDQSTWRLAHCAALRTRIRAARRHCAAFAGRFRTATSRTRPNPMTCLCIQPDIGRRRQPRAATAAARRRIPGLQHTSPHYLPRRPARSPKSPQAWAARSRRSTAAAAAGLFYPRRRDHGHLGVTSAWAGRNQEPPYPPRSLCKISLGIVVVSLATDGTDGPTDSAGGIADAATVARGKDWAWTPNPLVPARRLPLPAPSTTCCSPAPPRPTSTTWCSSSSTKPKCSVNIICAVVILSRRRRIPCGRQQILPPLGRQNDRNPLRRGL